MLALIVPLSELAGGVPSHPIVLPPEGPPTVWPPPFPSHGLPGQGQPGGGVPSHPIAGTPPGFWGGSPIPTPTPPIYIPVEPPAGTPGLTPGHPIYIPVYPSHPIASTGELKEALKAAIKDFFEPGYRPPESGMPQPKKA